MLPLYPPPQHLLGGGEAANTHCPSFLEMARVNSIDEVRMGIYPLHYDATWRFVQVDFRTRVVRLWGWTDKNYLRKEIVSLALETLQTRCP